MEPSKNDCRNEATKSQAKVLFCNNKNVLRNEVKSQAKVLFCNNKNAPELSFVRSLVCLSASAIQLNQYSTSLSQPRKQPLFLFSSMVWNKCRIRFAPRLSSALRSKLQVDKRNEMQFAKKQYVRIFVYSPWFQLPVS